ncbi:hypothetical protein GLOIN_2v325566 [Rhizophagus irregularis DAOM 181602=DAOM 197198]|uniref:Uncharacterized protein n=1 Tax=Rhizophagus irregularis (strain DAOM 181602 / DAOM 197198 / MUCL 43194) TaxID=747089 RepID=A0A2P4QS32_RHIID|nr:hypothetical protein GLOIN_2v325566 [Rhizophagus irregularis DAOM 181602=DAOM 197198]POG80440.1 hypothetical protein GLOIN_2v325566 [Rhizophagus irregularis DAOM 181602=DAOM 197198]|eukprot:XP_025187306.1 hypothetical protein GLOIN_2v325566 [Rhizophagus irregularis DAOM 181602=DAOM 197198]
MPKMLKILNFFLLFNGLSCTKYNFFFFLKKKWVLILNSEQIQTKSSKHTILDNYFKKNCFIKKILILLL